MSQMSLCIWLFFIPIKGGTIIDFLWEQITNWLKEVLISGIIAISPGCLIPPMSRSGTLWARWA